MGSKYDYYGSYTFLLETEERLKVKAPEEIKLILFGTEGQVEVTREVAMEYPMWFCKG